MLQLKLNRGILLRKAVSSLRPTRTLAIINCSPAGLLMQTTGRMPGVDIVAELRISPENFNSFYCNGDFTIVIGLHRLSSVLHTVGDQDSLTITYSYKDPNSNYIYITIENSNGTQRTCLFKITKTLTENVVNMFTSQFGNKVVVGIPSNKFRQILTHLREFGDTVNILVTAAQVKLTTANEEMVLIEKNGECVIVVNEVDEPVLLVFRLGHMESFLKASKLSDMVCMLRSQDALHTMLNCPVWPLGNIMYCFDTNT